MTRRPALPEKLAAAAHDELESLGVRILVDTRVTEVDRKGVHTGDGELVSADIRVWAAGIHGADILEGIGGLETTRSNQLVVGQTLQTTCDQRIFALGDCCACPRPDSDRATFDLPMPGGASAAPAVLGRALFRPSPVRRSVRCARTVRAAWPIGTLRHARVS